MKVLDDSKLRQAREVLKRVEKLVKGMPKEVFWVDNYQNCRESGFVIRGWFFVYGEDKAYSGGELYVAFSENRNSDNIVVYVDRVMANEVKKRNLYTSAHGNLPTDEAYEKATYFDCEEYDAAAKFIVSVLKSFLKDAEKVAKENRAKELQEKKLEKVEAA